MLLVILYPSLLFLQRYSLGFDLLKQRNINKHGEGYLAMPLRAEEV
jgi:hypothetical protein